MKFKISELAWKEFNYFTEPPVIEPSDIIVLKVSKESRVTTSNPTLVQGTIYLALELETSKAISKLLGDDNAAVYGKAWNARPSDDPEDIWRTPHVYSDIYVHSFSERVPLKGVRTESTRKARIQNMVGKCQAFLEDIDAAKAAAAKKITKTLQHRAEQRNESLVTRLKATIYSRYESRSHMLDRFSTLKEQNDLIGQREKELTKLKNELRANMNAQLLAMLENDDWSVNKRPLPEEVVEEIKQDLEQGLGFPEAGLFSS